MSIKFSSGRLVVIAERVGEAMHDLVEHVRRESGENTFADDSLNSLVNRVSALESRHDSELIAVRTVVNSLVDKVALIELREMSPLDNAGDSRVPVDLHEIAEYVRDRVSRSSTIFLCWYDADKRTLEFAFDGTPAGGSKRMCGKGRTTGEIIAEIKSDLERHGCID